MLNSIDIVIVIIFNSILVLLTTVCSRKETQKKKKGETLTHIDGRRDMALQAIKKKCAGIVEEHKKKFKKEQSRVSTKDDHTEFDRYTDVKCYDKTRLILKYTKNNYIHANQIGDPRNLVTQGPMKNTIVNFWEMCIQEIVIVIVQLCQFTESGETQCVEYYPKIEGKTEKYEDIEVKYLKKKVHPIKGVTWAVLEVKTGGTIMLVDHIHVSWWSEKRIPDDPGPTMELSKWVQTQKKLRGSVAMCNDGEGRSVTFVAIMYTNYFVRRPFSVDTDMATAIRCLRNYVPRAVENKEDYLFLHACLVYSAMIEGMIEKNVAEPFLLEYKNYVRNNFRN